MAASASASASPRFADSTTTLAAAAVFAGEADG
jgi:hypothetical protein